MGSGEQGGWPPGRTRATHVGLITAGLEDELLWLVLPALHGRIGGGQAGRPQGELGLAVLLLQNTQLDSQTAARPLQGSPHQGGSQ